MYEKSTRTRGIVTGIFIEASASPLSAPITTAITARYRLRYGIANRLFYTGNRPTMYARFSGNVSRQYDICPVTEHRYTMSSFRRTVVAVTPLHDACSVRTAPVQEVRLLC